MAFGPWVTPKVILVTPIVIAVVFVFLNVFLAYLSPELIVTARAFISAPVSAMVALDHAPAATA